MPLPEEFSRKRRQSKFSASTSLAETRYSTIIQDPRICDKINMNHTCNSSITFDIEINLSLFCSLIKKDVCYRYLHGQCVISRFVLVVEFWVMKICRNHLLHHFVSQTPRRQNVKHINCLMLLHSSSWTLYDFRNILHNEILIMPFTTMYPC